MAMLLPFLAPVAEWLGAAGLLPEIEAALVTASAYASWAAGLIVQGALNEVGVQTVARIFARLALNNPGLAAAATQAEAVSNNVPSLESVLKDWTSWSLHEFKDKDSFGNTEVGSGQMPVFNYFQQQIGKVAEFRNRTITELIKNASTQQSPESVNQLHSAMKEWADMFKKVADFLGSSAAKPMIQAGLQTHANEINSAAQTL
ncbi:hypothetical protein COL940_007451 [Colletotrichum noveboracense]|nr:hypothetical protein COL940_007451 [Colletotrichum noveboracense]KAJ0281949.1 hypothetical protein CBS470a_008035 [Colletotrichum nupharicola]